MSSRRALLLGSLVAATVLAAPVAEAAVKPGKVKFGARLLKSGAKGKDVLALQRALATLGVPAPTDAVFGPGTLTAVKALETRQKWPVNGIVTRKDARRITKLVAKRKTSRPVARFYQGGGVLPAVTVRGTRAGTATLNVVDIATGLTTQSIPLSFSGPGDQAVSWNLIAATGAAAPDASYQFKLVDTDAGASISGGQTGPFELYAHIFPLVGKHNFGGAGARFGAGRPGHTHQGQDVIASCGQRLRAAQGGTVLVKAYQAGGAGNYVVIRGASSGTDYVYMHLKKPSWTVAGTVLTTGQVVGKVGNTGASSGCHLHFERWTAPGWYAGGAPYDPLAELTHWDSYS